MPPDTRRRRRDSSTWDDAAHALATGMGIVVAVVIFSVGLALLLALTVAILGHPAADGPKAWFVLAPGLLTGWAAVYFGGRGAFEALDRWFEGRLRNWRAQ